MLQMSKNKTNLIPISTIRKKRLVKRRTYQIVFLQLFFAYTFDFSQTKQHFRTSSGCNSGAAHCVHSMS